MKLQELFKQVNWNCVWKRMLELYPDQNKNWNGYKSCYENCIAMDAVISDMYIILKPWDGCVSVSGCDGTYEEYDDGTKVRKTYAIEFTAWKEWMGMKVDSTALKEYTPVDIVVHCLYEMTFVSFDENKIQKSINEIKEDIKKIDSGEMKMYTTEEVMDRIKNKFNIED